MSNKAACFRVSKGISPLAYPAVREFFKSIKRKSNASLEEVTIHEVIA